MDEESSNGSDRRKDNTSWWCWAKKALLWFPVIFLMAILIYCYYAYVVTFCALFLINGDPERRTRGALYLAAFHFLLVLFLWSFWATVFTDPGLPASIPNLVLSSPTQIEEDPEPIEREGKTWLPSSYARFCMTCQYVKPDRSHHCSVCKRCVLKMDHHCMWLNNCVGHSNYKLFIVTLFYAVLLGLFLCITVFQQLVFNAANDDLVWNDLQLLIALVLAFVFSIAALALLAYHIYLSSKNQTTIEALDEKDRVEAHVKVSEFRRNSDMAMSPRPDPKHNPFDLGTKSKNLKASWGQNCILWLIPIRDRTNGQGIWFPRQRTPMV